ncbi:MAG: tetratricopeptide repeat protein [Caldilineales bacterium]
MTTKLTRFCEAIIEAGWLAALIYVPLFFNVHSSRVFEPDKISVLRSIALVMAIAWLVKVLNDGLRRGQTGDGERTSLWRRILDTPLVLPTLLLVLAYLISTVFSINPRISFFGSYQRLQGTYSTLSYIVIFFLVLGHLRRPEQWRRMAYVIILVSVPIAIYGLLQRADLDPLPWGGDVQRRIAGNMGNAIFVAAYLLMAFFLTLERLLEHLGRLVGGDDNRQSTMDAVLAGFYLFIIAVQSLAILFTQSRGPLLGWLAGLFVFILLFLLGLRGRAGERENQGGLIRGLERWLWLPWIGLALAGLVFLVVFNIPGSPLAPLRTNPIIGRLGTALDLESQTARVRTLIWEGASELIGPHEPLQYPATGGEGDVTASEPDRLNALRPLIGYGPEAMWMAFNPFYPPDLAHYESRNASPDRSHNETFDSLVITGILGFIAYMALFLSIFFFSLSWLGLMRTRGQKILFFVLAIGGAVLGSLLAYTAMGNWVLFGIALPAGMSLAILAYILIAAIWNEVGQHPMRLGQRELIVMTVLATVIAHFIEIHFGIAIASTRTYFWIWSAVLVVVGMGWLTLNEQAEEPAPQPAPVVTTGRRKKRRGTSAPAPARPAPAAGQWDEVIIYAVALGIMLFIIAFNYIINPNVLDLRSTNPIVVFIQSFTSRVDTKLGERFVSLGLFWMVIFVVLVGTVVALLDIARSRTTAVTARWLGKGALISLAISLGMFFGLGLLHAATIAGDAARQQPGRSITLEQLANMSANHITELYIISLLLIVLLAFTVWRTQRGGPAWLGAGGWLAPAAGAVLAVVGLLIIFNLNASLVRADIVYKQGQAYDNAGRFTEAIQLYQMAIDEEPQEDYYYLFLGRAQLEQARASSGSQQQAFLANAEESLLRAQELNPLNTDHSANLGRLYLAKSQMTSGDERAAAVQKALDYYAVATRLSPNAAHLHNEYGTAYQVAGQPDKALEQFDISLALDQQYPDTYRRLGDFYQRSNQNDKAIEAYEAGLKIAPRDTSFHSNLGFLYAEQGDQEKAVEQNLAVLETRPNDLASIRNLAILYSEAGDYDSALQFAQRALELVTKDEDRAALQTLIDQLQAQRGG